MTTVPVVNQELLKLEREEAEMQNKRNARGDSLQHPGRWTPEMVAEWWARTLQRLAVKSKWVQRGVRAPIPRAPAIGGKELTRWPQARLEQACGAYGGKAHEAGADTSRAVQMAKCLFQRLRVLMQESGKRKQQMAKARSKAVLRPANAAATTPRGNSTPRQSVSRRPPRRQRSAAQPSTRQRGVSTAPATTATGSSNAMVHMTGDCTLNHMLSPSHQQRRYQQPRRPADRGRNGWQVGYR